MNTDTRNTYYIIRIFVENSNSHDSQYRILNVNCGESQTNKPKHWQLSFGEGKTYVNRGHTSRI